MSKGETPQAKTASEKPSKKGASGGDWIARGMLILGIVLLGSLLLFQELPREISRWYQAAAQVHSDRGEWSEAVRSLDRAASFDDRYPSVYQLRGEFTLREAEAKVSVMLDEAAEATKAGEMSAEQAAAAALDRSEILTTALELALADYEKSLELYSGNLGAHLDKVEILQRLGRHEEAVAECTRALQEALQAIGPEVLADAAKSAEGNSKAPTAQNAEAKFQLSQILNMLAYTKARGSVDLPQALAEIDMALSLLAQSGRADSDPTVRATYLDTRGLIHYRMGNYPKALLDLEAAVSDTQVLFAARVRQLDWERQITQNQKSFDQQVQRMRHNLAVIRHHRGQVYEAIGRDDAAKEDYAAAEQYGYSEELGVW